MTKVKKDLEIENFLNAKSVEPSNIVSNKIIGRISAELGTPYFKLMSRLLVAHMVSVVLTLLYCPQFGVGWFSNPGITSVFMLLGHEACSVLCGALLFGTSGVIYRVLLPIEYWRLYGRVISLGFVGAVFLTLAAFSGLASALTLSESVFWILGGIGAVKLLLYGSRSVHA